MQKGKSEPETKKGEKANALFPGPEAQSWGSPSLSHAFTRTAFLPLPSILVALQTQTRVCSFYFVCFVVRVCLLKFCLQEVVCLESNNNTVIE